MLGVSVLLRRGISPSRKDFLSTLSGSAYSLLQSILDSSSNASRRSSSELNLALLCDGHSALSLFDPASPFALACLSSLFDSVPAVQQLRPSLVPLLFSIACELAKPRLADSLRLLGFFAVQRFVADGQLDDRSMLRGQMLLVNGSKYESKLNRSEVCVMMCNLALNQLRKDDKIESILAKNRPINQQWMISDVSQIVEYVKTWSKLSAEKPPEFQK